MLGDAQRRLLEHGHRAVWQSHFLVEPGALQNLKADVSCVSLLGPQRHDCRFDGQQGYMSRNLDAVGVQPDRTDFAAELTRSGYALERSQ